MPKIIFFFIVILLTSSCKEAASEIENVQESQWEVVTDGLPKKVRVDSKAQTILNEWKDFIVLESSFDKISF